MPMGLIEETQQVGFIPLHGQPSVASSSHTNSHTALATHHTCSTVSFNWLKWHMAVCTLEKQICVFCLKVPLSLVFELSGLPETSVSQEG